jgi:hypothetical protein
MQEHKVKASTVGCLQQGLTDWLTSSEPCKKK